MRIAMIGLKGIPLRAGGVEIHVEEIASRLAEMGHEVVVYCRSSYSADKLGTYKGITLKYIPTINTKHLDAIVYSFFATISSLFGRFDIYHYHALGPSTVSWIPRMFRKKVVCTIHGLDWQRRKWGRLARLYLKLGEYCSAKIPHLTICVSEPLTKYYESKYGKKAFYIPNGISMPKERKANLILNKYGLLKDGYLLFLGRLVPEKGVHYLIEAFKRLDTGKKLVIAGNSSHSDSYVESLYKLASGCSNVIFTGFVEGELLEELYSNAYAYVLPSGIEGMSIGLLEAMSYGRLCLVSDIEENLAVVGEYGLSFRNGSVDDLYKKLEFILSNKSSADIKEAVHAYLGRRYDWNAAAAELERLYDGICRRDR